MREGLIERTKCNVCLFDFIYILGAWGGGQLVELELRYSCMVFDDIYLC